MNDFPDLWQRLQPRIPQLVPDGVADGELSERIAQAHLFDEPRSDMADCCRAGLFLLNDDLEAAHPLVQNIAGSTGAFWHGIVHRREGDYSNARYWWARTGDHEVFEALIDLVLHRIPDFPLLDELRSAKEWDPVLFTEWCQRAATWPQDHPHRPLLEQIQALEMKTLLQWCATRAARASSSHT